MVYQGHIRNGSVILDNDVRLAEGTPVMVQTLDVPPTCAADDPVYRLGELAARTGIADLALNVDHYLYGHPKVGDVQP